MSKHRLSFAFLLIVVVCCRATAGELSIVPFVVPVAVPVAVVQQPTLFYGVGQYAPVAATRPLTPGPSPTRGEGSVGPVVNPAALREQVDAVLVKRCGECHHGDRPHGDLALFDADGRSLEKLPRQLLVEATASRAADVPAMPPGEREKLTDQEWKTLQQWARMPKSFVY